jgi:hypothetical protein
MTDRFDRCPVGLADSEYVVDPRMVDPMAQHKNRAAEIQGLPMNLTVNGSRQDLPGTRRERRGGGGDRQRRAAGHDHQRGDGDDRKVREACR